MEHRVRIGDYGLVGDTRTAALIDARGSIDWLCLPHFDGDPVFGRAVAGSDGGHFALAPVGPVELVQRRYRPGTAVLETRWSVGSGQLTATDAMIADVRGTRLPTLCVVRRVEAHGAPVRVSVSFDPRFGPNRRIPRWRAGHDGLVCQHGGTALSLAVDRPIPLRPAVPVELDVEPGRPLTVVVTAADRGPLTLIRPDAAWEAMLADAERWRAWSGRTRYHGPHPAVVERSVITLRLLTYSPSGAPVAAPTTSLPEWRGGSRNWDYRYAWPRDASIGIGAFLGLGHPQQARAFLYWLLHASRLDRPHMPALLTLHGRRVPSEREIPGWPGFAHSTPVRFGNGARHQHQLDNYGWVLDAMGLLVDAGHDLYGETWRAGAGLADEVARRWREPDAGVWELRSAPAHNVHSKLMAWLALDRALHIAETHRTSPARRRRWQRERDAIGVDVVANGFDVERTTFVRAYGRRDLDAAVLLLPLVGLEPPDSPRVRGTIDAVRRELSAGGPLLYRYPPGDDGLDGPEGAFLPCSFWLVQALAVSGSVAEATALFDELVALGGPLGLFAEEADPRSGDLLGNYPQSLTHAALLQAALALQAASDAQDAPSSNPRATP